MIPSAKETGSAALLLALHSFLDSRKECIRAVVSQIRVVSVVRVVKSAVRVEKKAQSLTDPSDVGCKS